MTVILSISLNLTNPLPKNGKISFNFPENVLFPGTDSLDNVITALQCS